MATDDSKRLLINPIVHDWLKDLCPEFVPVTSFANWLLVEAMTAIENRPEGLTRVPRLGGTATPNGNTSLRSALALEEINQPTREQPGSAADPPVVIPPDLQGGGAVPSNAREAKKVQYTDGFNAFWKLYQSAPSKANSQNKIKAFRHWRTALLEEDAQRIIDAIGNCIRDQQNRIQRDEFCAPLPDCFRWLRDHGFAVHLEEHHPAEQKPTHMKWEPWMGR